MTTSKALVGEIPNSALTSLPTGMRIMLRLLRLMNQRRGGRELGTTKKARCEGVYGGNKELKGMITMWGIVYLNGFVSKRIPG